MSDGTLYGIAEIAEALGVSRHLIAQWRFRGKLPAPSRELASGPVWTAEAIEPWLDDVRQQRTANSS